jgi:hypothetical protein
VTSLQGIFPVRYFANFKFSLFSDISLGHKIFSHGRISALLQQSQLGKIKNKAMVDPTNGDPRNC